jgi:hypothetical protein
MSFFTREKKVAKKTHTEFTIEIDEDDLFEFVRLHDLKYERDARSVSFELDLSSKGSDQTFTITGRIK